MTSKDSRFDVINGWLKPAKHCPSPNYNQRPSQSVISLLVIHNISLPPGKFDGDFIEQFFCNTLNHSCHPYFESLQGMTVSAHCLIRRDGEVVQFVSFIDRAWHAGRSNFCGEEECNDFSIGIELEGTDDQPYTDDQYLILAEVTRTIRSAYPKIDLDRITGHSDIAPSRKTDPGPAFDWARYKESLNE